MKTAYALSVLVLSAAVGATAVAAGSSRAPAGAASGETWLEIPAVYDRVTAAGYHDISEIERERNGYEVKALGPEGERVKLLVDPVSGEVLDARTKGRKSDRRTDERSGAPDAR